VRDRAVPTAGLLLWQRAGSVLAPVVHRRCVQLRGQDGIALGGWLRPRGRIGLVRADLRGSHGLLGCWRRNRWISCLVIILDARVREMVGTHFLHNRIGAQFYS